MRPRLLVAALVVGTTSTAAGCGGTPSARPVAAKYLAAVQAGDYAKAAASSTTDAGTLSASYTQLLTALHASKAALALGAVTTDKDKLHATADFTATVTPSGLPSWRFTGSLPLERAKDGWKVVWSPTDVHPQLTAGERFAVTVKFGDRAAILDGNGDPLVASGPVVTVGIEPDHLKDRTGEIATLAATLKVDGPALTKRVAAAAPNAFVPVISLRQSDFDRVRRVLDKLPGVPYRKGTAVLAPTPTFARALLGRVGDATAEALAKLGPPYAAGDQVGLSGLEAAFEQRLAGTPTAAIVLTDAKGKATTTLQTFRGTPGQPLRVTLDPATQRAAEAALGPADTTDGTRMSLVAVRASTGAVLAVANRPGLSSLDTALVGTYPPGSTFKVITAAALLENGITPQTAVPCPPSIVVSGQTFHNFEGESRTADVPFATDFAISCNTAFIGAATRSLDAAKITSAAAQFGIGQPWQLGVPAVTGKVPSPSSSNELAATAIGQGRVGVSPLDMALVAATVDAGAWHPPALVTTPAQPAQPSPKELPASVTGALRSMMRSVVTGGTAAQAFAGFAGPPVYGKTGTAEYGDKTKTHAWFIGYRGDVAFAVIVEGGGVGGTAAAPIAATFLRALH